MIKLDLKQFVIDRLWFGWWYSDCNSSGCPGEWLFEKHQAVPLLTVMKLEDARRRCREHEELNNAVHIYAPLFPAVEKSSTKSNSDK